MPRLALTGILDSPDAAMGIRSWVDNHPKFTFVAFNSEWDEDERAVKFYLDIDATDDWNDGWGYISIMTGLEDIDGVRRADQA